MANILVDKKIKKIRLLSITVIFLFYFIVIWYLLRNLDFFIRLSKFNLKNLFYALLFLVIAYVSFVIRWRYIYALKNIKLNFKKCLIYQLIEFAFFFLPFKSNYLIIPLILKNEHSIKLRKTIPIRICILFLDFSIVILLSITCLFSYFNQYIKNYFILLALVTLTIILFSSLNFLRSIVKLINKKFPSRRYGFILKEWLQNLNSVFRPRLIVKGLFVSLIPWVLEGAVLYFIIKIFVSDLSLLTAVSMQALSLLIGVMSSIPGGVGVTEGSLTWLLFSVGIPLKYAVYIALLNRIILVVLPALIGTPLAFLNRRLLIFRYGKKSAGVL